MPSEDTPVRKIGSIEARNFWARHDSIDVTRSFRIKEQLVSTTPPEVQPPLYTEPAEKRRFDVFVDEPYQHAQNAREVYNAHARDVYNGRDHFMLPYHRQQGPFDPISTHTSHKPLHGPLNPLSPTGSRTPLGVINNNETNIEVLRQEIRKLESERVKMNKQHKNALMIIKGLSEYISNQ